MAPTAAATIFITKVAFPFVLLIVIILAPSCCLFTSAEPTETYLDFLHTEGQVNDDVYGDFFGKRIGLKESPKVTVNNRLPLGRNMPTDDINQRIISSNNKVIGQDDEDYDRNGRSLQNRKAWLDRYKEMLTRWERNDDDASREYSTQSNENLEFQPVTPTVKERYVIPDSSSVSYLIAGRDKYQPVQGRNNGNLEDTLPDHKIIEGLKRLMTSTTTRRTTKPYRRATTYSTTSIRQYTTQSTFPTTTKRTTRTTPASTTLAQSKYQFVSRYNMVS